MKKIIEVLKEYWNLYSPFILSSIASWLVDWNANQMVSINQWIGITLSLMALFTMMKFLIFPKKKKNVLEKAISNQKVVKNADLIIHQEQEVKKQIKLIKKIVKGTKKMFKWISKNKGAIIGLLTLILAVLEYAFEFIYKLIPYDLGFNVIGTTLAFIGTVVATLTSGFGSTKFKEAVAQVKDQLNGDETDLQNISSVKYLERQIMVYEKAKLTTEKDIAYLDKKYGSIINDYRTCQQLGLPVDEETKEKYIEYTSEYEKLQGKLNAKSSALQTYKAKLEQVKAQLG